MTLKDGFTIMHAQSHTMLISSHILWPASAVSAVLGATTVHARHLVGFDWVHTIDLSDNGREELGI